MVFSDKPGPDNAYLVRYLLGTLPAEETERLDELSVTDDDFAWRLRDVENDLVDAYVHSELSGETLQQFKTVYSSSAERRQKVSFAEGLHRFQSQAALASQRSSRETASKLFFSRWFNSPRLGMQFAAAAFLTLLIFGWLVFDDVRLRYEMNDISTLQNSIEQNTRELERELRQQRTANAENQKKLELADQSGTTFNQLKTVSLLIPPPVRGISSIKTIAVHPKEDFIVLLLALDSTSYAAYSVTLKDPATGKAIWRSTGLEPAVVGNQKVISAGFRADLLKPQTYLAELSGIKHDGLSQIVESYPFHIVLR